MDEYIIKNGKKYKLTLVEEEEDDLVKAYISASEGVEQVSNPSQNSTTREAIPKVSEYRERFKKRQLSILDVKKAKPNYTAPLVKNDASLEQFNYKGEKLFFGEGITRE
jgi:hypothetical protein